MGVDALKDEVKKYGLKVGEKKYMIKQLTEIWTFLNKSNLNNFNK